MVARTADTRRSRLGSLGAIGPVLLACTVACTRGNDAPSGSAEAASFVSSATPAASAGAAPSSTASSALRSAPSGDVARLCQEICGRSQSLHCPQTAQCMPNCLAMATATPCSSELLAMQRCLAAQPLEHWECSQDGVGAIRVGYCDDEQGAAVHCMTTKMR